MGSPWCWRDESFLGSMDLGGEHSICIDYVCTALAGIWVENCESGVIIEVAVIGLVQSQSGSDLQIIIFLVSFGAY